MEAYVKIVPAGPEHLETVLANSQRTYDEHHIHFPTFIGPSIRAVIASQIHTAIGGGCTEDSPERLDLLVIETERGIAGHALLSTTPALSQPSFSQNLMQIVDISLAPAFRGKGLGKQLLEKIVQLGTSRKISVIAAQVWHGNDAGHRLFLSANFDKAASHFGKRLLQQLRLSRPSDIYTFRPSRA